MNQVLPKTLELHERLRDGNVTCADNSACQMGFADFLQQSQENTHYFSTNMRKTVAISDISIKITEVEAKEQSRND